MSASGPATLLRVRTATRGSFACASTGKLPQGKGTA
jgi:hypothetical protein